MTDMVRAGLLAGKRAVVTGAARGIGQAVSKALAAEGAELLLVDVVADELAQTAAALGPGRASTCVLDITDEDATNAAAEAAGRMDIVVVNAGILLLKPALDLDLASWKRVIDVNLTGSFITARAFARHMRADARQGSIIFTSSLFGRRGGAENAAYSASKFGVVGLMECLAAELAPDGIRVNCVCPGAIDTGMLDALFEERGRMSGVAAQEVRRGMERRIPARRLGTMDEVAGAFVWLASDLSSYVTGQSIVVDGGWQVG